MSESASAFVQEGLSLQASYKDLILQAGEVDRRIELWNKAFDITSREAMQSNIEPCNLCAQLSVHSASSSNTPHHRSAHGAAIKYHLAESLGDRFSLSFNNSDMEDRVKLCRDALHFAQEYQDERQTVPIRASLGSALSVQHRLTGQESVFRESFDMLSSALQSCPSNPQYLVDFGALMLDRFAISKAVEDLDQALASLRVAHEHRTGHRARGEICERLGAAVYYHGHMSVSFVDIADELVQLYRESVRWRPLGHHSDFQGWSGLSMAYGMLFRKTAIVDDLNRSVTCGRIACDLLNPRYFKAWRFFTNMSAALAGRHEVTGDMNDLNEAMVYARRGISACVSREMRAELIQDLVDIMLLANESTGDVEILSDAIVQQREALENTHDAYRPYHLRTIGKVLIRRGLQSGHEESLKDGTDYIHQALAGLAERGQAAVDCVLLLGDVVIYRHNHHSQDMNLLDVILARIERLESQMQDQDQRPSVLLQIGRLYRTRFHHGGPRDDILSALKADERALVLQPEGYRLRARCLTSLAEDLMIAVEHQVETSSDAFSRAVNLQNQAVQLVPTDHPEYSRTIIAQAKLFLIPNTPYTNCEKAFSILISALQSLRVRVYECLSDLIPVLEIVEKHHARQVRDGQLSAQSCILEIYRAVIDTFPRLASWDTDHAHWVNIMTTARDIASKAASHAIILGQPSLALELLEAGRAVFWTQHLRLPASFDTLGLATAKELRTIARFLESATGSEIPLDLEDNLARVRLEQVMARRRHLSQRFDQLVLEVRTRPGMGDFLRSLDYQRISSAARRGPVAVVQESWIIVIPAPGSPPCVVPVHALTREWILSAIQTIRHSAHMARTCIEQRAVRVVPVRSQIDTMNYGILEKLWTQIAQPLLEVLGWTRQEGRARPRLTLCLTGIMAFLPVHAAGTYCRQDKAGVDACFSDYCVVSYTPTLGALLERDSYPAAGEMKMLLAAAPRPFRSLPLPAAEKEMDVLSKIVPRRFRMPTAVAHDSSSYARTADDVLHLLPDATILHLACHGYQDPVKPLESGFLMEDKMIKVADLVQLNLPNARLAFLSACETAQGDMERPDEALHLAATMLFTGFKSVVATMWSMNDVDGPVVAETVYRELFAGDGDELDFDVVPYALDAAIRKLREQGLEISRWAPYIHVGV